jgi:Uma2 family endonuclease
MKVAEPVKSLPPGARIWPLTVAAYRVLGEAGLISPRTELLHGIVYQKMSKSPLHSALVRELVRLLAATPLPGCFVSTEQPLTCDDYSEPEPDIAVIRGSPDSFWRDHPHSAELVIEVCVISHAYDRSQLAAYAAAGVKECWLVLGPERQIEVHRQPAGDQFAERQVHGPGGQLTCAALPTFTLNLDTLFKE